MDLSGEAAKINEDIDKLFKEGSTILHEEAVNALTYLMQSGLTPLLNIKEVYDCLKRTKSITNNFEQELKLVEQQMEFERVSNAFKTQQALE